MGLITSPNHFQFVMQMILSGNGGADQNLETEKDKTNLVGEDCFIYIDDLLIFTKSDDLEHHLKTLSKVIDRLTKFGLKAKPSKANIAMTEVKFLGWILSKEERQTRKK